jgi:Spy/CpxP family protein refolding chaperone
MTVTQKLSLSLSLLLLLATFWFLVPHSLAEDSSDRDWTRIARELQLTDQQKRQILEVRRLQNEEVKTRQALVSHSRGELNQALSAQLDDGSLKDSFRRWLQSKNELQMARFEHNLRIRAILTPEQRKKFQVLSSE